MRQSYSSLTGLTAGERLAVNQETVHGAQQFRQRSTLVVARDGLVQLLPDALDLVHPGIIGRLEQQFEAGMARQPTLREAALVYLVIIEDEHDPPCRTIGTLQMIEQVNEQQRILARVLDPDQAPGAGVQGPRQVRLDILPRGRDHLLDALGHPGIPDLGIEVDIHFVHIEHGGARGAVGQTPADGAQAPGFVRVLRAQYGTGAAVTEG